MTEEEKYQKLVEDLGDLVELAGADIGLVDIDAMCDTLQDAADAVDRLLGLMS